MMDAVHIRRLVARYRLPPSAVSARRRLDGLLDGLLDGGLEAALAAAGVPVDEEVCIRRLALAARLRLSLPDGVLSADWSRAIAAEVRRVLDGAGDNVVRYRSRVHALVDLVAACARGDLRRSWAWRQLGLPGEGGPRERIVRALIEAPAAIVPVLREVARRSLSGADAGAGAAFVALVDRLDASDWLVLAERALVASGADPSLASAPTGEEPPPVAIRRLAERIVHASSIAAAAAALPGALAPAIRRALAALAILDGEPGRLGRVRGRDAQVVAAVAEALATAIADERPVAEARPGEESAREGHAPSRARETERAAPSPERQPPRLDEEGADESLEAAASPSEEAAPGRAPVEKQAPAEDAPVELRLRARTRAGGLLFLLHLVAELDLVEDALTHPVLGDRPLRWCLHRLALALLPLGEDDPAALAFCGLPPRRPRAPLPVELEGAPTESEAAALAEFAHRMAARLGELLDERERRPSELLAEVCARGAEVVADPGWIEVRFALDQVSVPVRRAGLDLDPGWLPWLGVVVRFAYGPA